MPKKLLTGIGAAGLLILLFGLFLFLAVDEPVEVVDETSGRPAPGPAFTPLRTERIETAEHEEPAERLPAPEEFSRIQEERFLSDQSALPEPDGPRAIWVEQVRPGEIRSGYSFHGTRLTERGFELGPPGPGAAGAPRVGIVESPEMTFDFPSSESAVQWSADLPEGTSVLVEVSVSADGETWEPWSAGDMQHDSQDLLPEEQAAPAGKTPGHLTLVWDEPWTHWRYRVSLYAEGPDSPVFSSIRNAYRDPSGAGDEFVH